MERKAVMESWKRVALVGVGGALLFSLTEGVFCWIYFPFSSLPRLAHNFTLYLISFLVVGLGIVILGSAIYATLSNRPGVDLLERRAGVFLVVGPSLTLISLYASTFSRFQKMEGDMKWATVILVCLAFLVCFWLTDAWVKRKGFKDQTKTLIALQGACFLFINTSRFVLAHPKNFIGPTYSGIPPILVFLGASILAYIIISQLIRAGQQLYQRTIIFRIIVYSLVGALMSLILITLRPMGGAEFHPAEVSGNSNPNVVLIVLDTARQDHFSFYGYERATTPFLDSLTTNAFVFQEAISPAPWTLPAHASIFTGLYPTAHGANWKTHYLDDDNLTMAEFLSSLGYQTFGVSNNAMVRRSNGLAQGFDVFLEMWRETVINPTLRDMIERAILEVAGAWDGGARRSNQWIYEWFRYTYNEKQPFFLFVNYMELHLGSKAPDDYRNFYLDDEASDELGEIKARDLYKLIAADIHISEEEFDRLRDLYDGDLLYLDRRVGEVILFLSRFGLLDHTFLVITSDHGENLGDHGMIDHQLNIYDTLLKIPLVVKFPKTMSDVETVEGQVQTVDIFPTLLEILGLESEFIPFQIQGSTLIRGKEGTERSFSVAEYKPPSSQIRFYDKKYPMVDLAIYDREMWTIRTDSLKYIWYSRGERELFDIARDPGEKTNLVDDLIEAEERMMDMFLGLHGSFSLADSIKREAEIDEETLNELRSLGYVH